MYQDETLTCTDCSAPFSFTSGEQEFYAQKGFTNKPNRCPDCRAARKGQRSTGNSYSASSGSYGSSSSYGSSNSYGSRPKREMFSTTCSSCGKEAQVPFQPRGDRPVYCRDCFAARPSYR